MLTKIHFCADPNEVINFRKHHGDVLAHHLNSKKFHSVKVCEFKENNKSYITEVMEFCKNCLDSAIDEDCDIYFCIRLGLEYYSDCQNFLWEDMNVMKFSNYLNSLDKFNGSNEMYFKQITQKHDKPHPAFNAESGVNISDYEDLLLGYICEKGFQIEHPEKTQEIKVFRNFPNHDFEVFSFDAETLKLNYWNDVEKCGNFDVIYSKHTPFIKDTRLQITAVLEESILQDELIIRDKHNKLSLTCDPASIQFVRREDTSTYNLSDDYNELTGAKIQFKLDKKTQFNYSTGDLEKCMTTVTGAHILFTCKGHLFKNQEYTLKFMETLVEYMQWLSEMTTQLQIDSNKTVHYYSACSDEGFTYKQELFMRDLLRKSDDYYALFNTDKSQFEIDVVKKQYKSILVELNSNRQHPKYSEAKQLLQIAFAILDDPESRRKYNLLQESGRNGFASINTP